MGYLIKITYGDKVTYVSKFRFNSNESDTDAKFDAAVKAINAEYKEHGHFKTKADVLNHFRRYGFYSIDI